MRQAPVKVRISGSVTPPKDLDKAAQATLGALYAKFIRTHGPDFTPQQLVEFTEKH